MADTDERRQLTAHIMQMCDHLPMIQLHMLEIRVQALINILDADAALHRIGRSGIMDDEMTREMRGGDNN